MEGNTTQRLVYFLKIAKAYKNQLGSLRHWGNLKMAIDKEFIWLKDFTEEQIHSIAVKQLPFKELFYVKEQKLFPLGNQLPIGKAPSFLWTPIEKALKVELPLPNPNFFGLEENIEIQIIPSSKERKGIALLISLEDLKNYIETAPSIRLKNLSWIIIEEDKALVIGTPLLPLPGQVFWKDNKFLIPLGFHFDLPILSQFINKKINPEYSNWVLWNKDGSYSLLAQDLFVPLSLSSVRLSIV